MRSELRGRDLLSLRDLTRQEIELVFEATTELKTLAKMGHFPRLLEGKTLAMVFQKTSTRTRVSFEVAMAHLGGHALFLSANDLQLRIGETILDTARVLGRYVDGIMARVYGHQDVVDLAEGSRAPVINGLSDFTHPCQGLTDFYTILEHKGKLSGLTLAYVGDGNNVANSLIFGGTKLGLHVRLGTPSKYRPPEEVLKTAEKFASESGGSLEIFEDPVQAVSDADVVYTDTWVSMGQEKEKEERLKVFQPYQLSSKLLKHAKKDAIVMHCLPAHRGLEITDEVMDGPQSVIFDQAENRLHVQKAILALLL
ncbi:MAG: ornithine carbamoyltransferase [Caldiserica bacterium]|jgi:ornithine carbamoyltransferase|nr:ornithine carbamoyltransferase [Caldisericota bacterium]